MPKLFIRWVIHPPWVVHPWMVHPWMVHPWVTEISGEKLFRNELFCNHFIQMDQVKELVLLQVAVPDNVKLALIALPEFHIVLNLVFAMEVDCHLMRLN